MKDRKEPKRWGKVMKVLWASTDLDTGRSWTYRCDGQPLWTAKDGLIPKK